jgi:serine protease AprX
MTRRLCAGMIPAPSIQAGKSMDTGILTFIVIILCMLWPVETLLDAQTSLERYRLQFTDKNHNPYSLDQPGEFLSPRSIARRQRQGIQPDSFDLPVSRYYLDSLKTYGVSLFDHSKWFNTVIIGIPNPALLYTLKDLGFVQRIDKVRSAYEGKSMIQKQEWVGEAPFLPFYYLDYGYSANQIMMLSGHFLHSLSFTGKNMSIAILDAGFANTDVLPAFQQIISDNRIISTYDFVDLDPFVLRSSAHGTIVFSILGGYIEGELMGTAPEAGFLLLISEDVLSESQVEEDHWISAAEFADSAGVDVINTSLGYSIFDDPSENYSYADMNGSSARITQGTAMAASRGMIVVVSAGNEGNKSWRYITAPADGKQVLAVGAVDQSRTIAYFSSRGPTFDGRVKPDVVATGLGTVIQQPSGTVGYGNGTSYAAPLITGLVACLWQAFPEAKATEVIDAVTKSADRYFNPDTLYGYGIPNFRVAYLLLEKDYGSNTSYVPFACNAFPNPFTDHLYIELHDDKGHLLTYYDEPLAIEIYRLTGEKIGEYIFTTDYPFLPNVSIPGLQLLEAGTYIISITTPHGSYHTMAVKVTNR